MDVQLTWADCDEARDYVVPNVLSPRDLVSRPDNIEETLLHTRLTWSESCDEAPAGKIMAVFRCLLRHVILPAFPPHSGDNGKEKIMAHLLGYPPLYSGAVGMWLQTTDA